MVSRNKNQRGFKQGVSSFQGTGSVSVSRSILADSCARSRRIRELLILLRHARKSRSTQSPQTKRILAFQSFTCDELTKCDKLKLGICLAQRRKP